VAIERWQERAHLQRLLLPLFLVVRRQGSLLVIACSGRLLIVGIDFGIAWVAHAHLVNRASQQAIDTPSAIVAI
jgi:hypothetical protein